MEPITTILGATLVYFGVRTVTSSILSRIFFGIATLGPQFLWRKYVNYKERGKIARNHHLETAMIKCLRKTFEAFRLSCEKTIKTAPGMPSGSGKYLSKVFSNLLKSDSAIENALPKLPTSPRDAGKYLSSRLPSQIHDTIQESILRTILNEARGIPQKEQNEEAFMWLSNHGRGVWSAFQAGFKDPHPTTLAKTFIHEFTEEVKNNDKVYKIISIDTQQVIVDKLGAAKGMLETMRDEILKEFNKISEKIEKTEKTLLEAIHESGLILKKPERPQYFLGRDREIKIIEELLRKPGKPMVVVSGELGIGKSAIACMIYHGEDLFCQDGETARQFQHRLWFANCREQLDPKSSATQSVVSQFLNTSGCLNDTAVLSKAFSALGAVLKDDSGLLVLDNADAFIEKAPLEFIRLCKGLRNSCGNLSVLITLSGSWKSVLRVQLDGTEDPRERAELDSFIDQFTVQEFTLHALPNDSLLEIFLRHQESALDTPWERSSALERLIAEADGIPDLVVNWASLSRKKHVDAARPSAGEILPDYPNAQALLDEWNRAWREHRRSRKNSGSADPMNKNFELRELSYTKLWERFFTDDDSRMLLRWLGFLPAGIHESRLREIVSSPGIAYRLFVGLGIGRFDSNNRLRLRVHVRSLAARAYPLNLEQRKKLEDHILAIAVGEGEKLRDAALRSETLERLLPETENFEAVVPGVVDASLRRATPAILGLGEFAFRGGTLNICEDWLASVIKSRATHIAQDIRARAVVLRGHFAVRIERDYEGALSFYEDAYQRFDKLDGTNAAKRGFVDIANGLVDLAAIPIVFQKENEKTLRHYMSIRDRFVLRFALNAEIQLRLAKGAVNAISAYGNVGRLVELEEWGKILKEVACKPEFSANAKIQLELVKGAVNAILVYGDARRFEELEEWGKTLKEVASKSEFSTNTEIQLELAKGAVNALTDYGKAVRLVELEEWGKILKEVASKLEFSTNTEIQLELAKGAVNAIFDYGKAVRLVELEEWGETLKEVASKPEFSTNAEVQSVLAMGAFNVFVAYGNAGRLVKLEEWGKILKEVACKPEFSANAKIQLELVKGAVNAILVYGDARRFEELEEWGKTLKEVASKSEFSTNAKIQLRLAMGAYNALTDYGKAMRFEELEEWGKTLKEVASKPEFSTNAEIQSILARGAVNAFTAYESTPGCWLKFDGWADLLAHAADRIPENETMQKILAMGAHMIISAYARINQWDRVGPWMVKLRAVADRFPACAEIQQIMSMAILVFARR